VRISPELPFFPIHFRIEIDLRARPGGR